MAIVLEGVMVLVVAVPCEVAVLVVFMLLLFCLLLDLKRHKSHDLELRG